MEYDQEGDETENAVQVSNICVTIPHKERATTTIKRA